MNTQNSMTWSKLIDIQVADRVIYVSLGMHGLQVFPKVTGFSVLFCFVSILSLVPLSTRNHNIAMTIALK